FRNFPPAWNSMGRGMSPTALYTTSTDWQPRDRVTCSHSIPRASSRTPSSSRPSERLMKNMKKMMPRRFAGAGLAGLLGLVAFLGFPGSARAQNLARGLLDRAPEIIKVLQTKQQFHNVG